MPTPPFFLLLIFSYLKYTVDGGILYPRASQTREILSLDGIYHFALSDPNNPTRPYEEQWYRKDLRTIEDTTTHRMPVPASYNDISTNSTIRDFVGPVWYQKRFFVPKSWSGQKVWVRFSSVCREAEVVSHYYYHYNSSEFILFQSGLTVYGLSGIVSAIYLFKKK